MDKKSKKFMYALILLAVLSIILIVFIDIKTVIILFSLCFLLILYILYPKRIQKEMIIAFFIAFAWTLFYPYEYTANNLMIGRINLFPLVVWTAGLVVLAEVYKKTEGHKFFKTILTYWICLFSLEYIGYHLLNIQLNSNYPSFLGLGFMHAPFYMQMFYISVGPIYLLIINYLDNKKKK